MKGYSIKLNQIGICREVGINRSLPCNNYYPIRNITSNSCYEDSKSIINFGFKVDKDNNIQGLKSSDGCVYAFVAVNFYEDVPTIQEINLNHYRKGLEYWSKSKEERAEESFYDDMYYTREYPSKEFPYRIYFYGCDDSSFTKCYETLEDVKDILSLITSDEYVDTYEFFNDLGFYFTN